LDTKVISAFPGIGKTYFVQNSNLRVADSDSSKFSWLYKGVRHPDFPWNYMEHIKELMGTIDIILVSSHRVVREALVENNIDFVLIFPERNLKAEYIERFKLRGNDMAFIDMISDNWDTFIDEMQNQKGCKIIELHSGQFLSQIIERKDILNYF